MYVPHQQTKVVKINPHQVELDLIKPMAEIIRKGGLVAFPTETVYGLGANALDPQAVSKIFTAKGRPADNPLIVHISDLAMAEKVAGKLPEPARRAINAFWPGPLTVVVPCKDIVPDIVTASLDTVGLRMPDNKIALALIAEAGVPVAAPSANISGRPSPTNAKRVAQDMAGKIEAIIDGGVCEYGLESTVVDFSGDIPIVLRPGGVTIEELEKVIEKVKYDASLKNPEEIPRSPGMKYTHYSPLAELIIVEGNREETVAKVSELAEDYRKQGKKVGIMASDENVAGYSSSEVISLGNKDDLKTVSAKLFETLRYFDDIGVDVIISESFDCKGIGVALMNRLRKAAGYNIIKA